MRNTERHRRILATFMDLECKTVVRSAAEESNIFGMEVGIHQGSAISSYFYLLLMGVLTEDVRKDVPGLIIFADDIVHNRVGPTLRPGGEH